jgi:hypothetical protein
MIESIPEDPQPPIGYADWLAQVGTLMQNQDMAEGTQAFGQHLIDASVYMKQQDFAIQVLTALSKAPEPEDEAGNEGYPDKLQHPDPKAALMLADGDFLEALALLSYRQHQAGKEKPDEATVEAIGRTIVMFLTSLRQSPELLNMFANAFNVYSSRMQERMATRLNALSETIH